jgi:hypothetical protein
VSDMDGAEHSPRERARQAEIGFDPTISRMTQPATNPYAPPESTVTDRPCGEQEIWREGKSVVSARDAHLPDRCVVCNEPAEDYWFLKKMSWHSPWLFLLLLANLLIYLIVALCVQKTARVRVALCPRHRARRQLGLWCGWLGLFASVACLVSPGLYAYPDDMTRDVVASMGLIGLVGFPIVALVMTQVVRPRRIDSDHVWLKVGKPFADSFATRD